MTRRPSNAAAAPGRCPYEQSCAGGVRTGGWALVCACDVSVCLLESYGPLGHYIVKTFSALTRRSYAQIAVTNARQRIAARLHILDRCRAEQLHPTRTNSVAHNNRHASIFSLLLRRGGRERCDAATEDPRRPTRPRRETSPTVARRTKRARRHRRPPRRRRRRGGASSRNDRGHDHFVRRPPRAAAAHS